MEAIKDYTKITDEQITAEVMAEYKAKKIVEQEAQRKKLFYDAKEVDYNKANEVHAAAILVLNKKWQKAEDNNFTI